MLVRWEPIIINGRKLPVDEVFRGEYEISLSSTVRERKKIKKSIQKLTDKSSNWTKLPGEDRIIFSVKEGTELYWLIEEAKSQKNVS